MEPTTAETETGSVSGDPENVNGGCAKLIKVLNDRLANSECVYLALCLVIYVGLHSLAV